jgi:4-hydroxy-tetrahydrodipicolinate synthase
MKAIKGSLVALITPMNKDGSLDKGAFCNLIDWHIKNQTDGLIIAGTTGESPTVDFKEHIYLIELAKNHSSGRIPIIAGTGANSTSEAILLTKEAANIGVEASLQVVPYYNKPSQLGLFLHFKAIADSVELPIILYNVPGRTVADLTNETIVKLSKITNIVGIKDATADLSRGQWLIKKLPDDFLIYSGDDNTAVALILCGADGNISVTANVLPGVMSKLCKLALSGNSKKAVEINEDLLPIHKILFLEANPIPVKWLMYQMGLITEGIRLPLTSPEDLTKKKLIDILKLINVLQNKYS